MAIETSINEIKTRIIRLYIQPEEQVTPEITRDVCEEIKELCNQEEIILAGDINMYATEKDTLH